MVNYIKSIITSENNSSETQIFNLVQAIYLIGLLCLSGVIYVCFPKPTCLYYTFLMCFLILVSFYDVNTTGSYIRCACIISAVSNFLFLPICYLGYGKLICCVPIYFILGILYTVLLLGGKLGLILSLVETAYMTFVIIFVGNYLPNYKESPPTMIDYIAIIIAIVLVGVLSALAINTKVKQYNEEYVKMKEAHLSVIDAYNSKDIFFANTSHEIRTPLNAIVGTVNLLLEEELDLQVKDNVYNILNSCNALLSITDELISLSNSETSNDALFDDKYDFSEMISDITNMMAVRLMESVVTLYVEIDKNVPKYLTGESGRVRQLFINILNNAVKYTKEGKIVLRIGGEKTEGSDFNLKVEVEDTGIGIKEDVIETLFSDYKRDEDLEKRSIEGTGLGLSLCKEIVNAMGGQIGVNSQYHVGSTFYFNILQKCEEYEPISKIKEKVTDGVIIFEKTPELSQALRKILSQLDVNATPVEDRMEFETCILTGSYHYVFIAVERYLENNRFIDRKLDSQRVIIISDISQSFQFNRNCYIVTRPMHIINVAMALNNESNNYSREIIQKGGFTCPNTTMLVVDDNITNLEVASGILKRYESNVVTAISGMEALNVIKSMHVDIIFLDYMMPEMNGIDTLYEIRKIESDNARTVPVVALTANVVSGAKEMFFEAGFADYVSKPIDINKLENAIRSLLPREQLKIKI